MLREVPLSVAVSVPEPVPVAAPGPRLRGLFPGSAARPRRVAPSGRGPGERHWHRSVPSPCRAPLGSAAPGFSASPRDAPSPRIGSAPHLARAHPILGAAPRPLGAFPVSNRQPQSPGGGPTPLGVPPIPGAAPQAPCYHIPKSFPSPWAAERSVAGHTGAWHRGQGDHTSPRTGRDVPGPAGDSPGTMSPRQVSAVEPFRMVQESVLWDL